MDHEHSQLAMNSISHAASMIQSAFQEAAGELARPAVIYRPTLSIDGNKWCALYGPNPMEGVCGFGDSPAEAMWDFDKNWYAKLPAAPTGKGE